MVISAAAPGNAPDAIGVFLVDKTSDRPWRRFRRDLDELIPDEADVLELLEEDFALKCAELGAGKWLEWLEEHASHFIRVSQREEAVVHDFPQQLSWLYHRHIRPRVLPFRTHLPVYGLQAAAGRWGPERDVSEEAEDWVEVPPALLRRGGQDLFVARVCGRSMEPLIPDGSWCVFRGGAALGGSRNGRRVLVANYGEPGEQRFTVKRYESVKRAVDDDRTEQVRIILHPLNPEFPSWEIDYEPMEGGDSGQRIRVIGEFIAVLDEYSPEPG